MLYLIVGLMGLALGEAIILDLDNSQNKIQVVKKSEGLKMIQGVPLLP
jgi:hypothetical protein